MTEDPARDMIESLGKGLAKGTLEWTKEEVVQLVKDINADRVELFNEFSLAIQQIRIERSSSEWKIYSLYVKTSSLRKLVNLGLQLRLNSNDKTKLDKLRGKILRKFKLDGLHVAEFVGSKILGKFILSNVDVNKSVDELTAQVEDILKNIERDVTFIHSETKPKNTTDKVVNKINVLAPALHILTSKGHVVGKCKTITKDIFEKIKEEYVIEEFSFENEYVVFFKKKDKV